MTNPTISIIKLNLNILNNPIKWQRLSNWIKNINYVVYKETRLRFKDINMFRVKGQKYMHHAITTIRMQEWLN